MTLSRLISRIPRPRAAEVLVCGVLALGAAGAPAIAQIGLPESIINPPSGTLSAEEKAEITKKVIDPNKAGLSGDADAISRSRRALLSPLRSKEVATAFRIEYSTQLVPILRPLAGEKADQTAINATIIAGEIGTKEAMGVLLAALKDSRASVRLVAAQGYARTFATARVGQPAIIARDALGALKDLDAAFLAEGEQHVADALAMAIDAAVRSDATRLPGVRAEAIKLLANSAGARVRDGKSAGLAAAFARAGDSLLDAVNEKSPGLTLSPELMVEAGGYAGDLISMGVRTDPAILSPERLSEARQLLKQAENLYYFSHQNLDPSSKPVRAGLGESFGADPNKFRKDALQILDILTGSPFKLKKERFPTK